MVSEVVRVLGIKSKKISSERDLAFLAQKGIPRYAVESIAFNFGASKTQFEEYLNVTLRSIQKYKSDDLLTSNISDHLIQLAKLIVLGKETLGEENFRKWLNEENPAIGIRPVQLLKTATGIQTVADELIRIEYSVFA